MKTKKLLTMVMVIALSLGALAGCGDSNTDENKDKNGGDTGKKEQQLEKLTVAASPTPHAEILVAVKDLLAKEGYELEVKEFTDYVLPNTALNDGSVDANYFQHQPYLDDFNVKKEMDLKGVVAVHYEPFAIYKGKKQSLDDLQEGDIIAVPNDTTNEARALQLLETQGLITLKEGVGLEATKKDIVKNPKKLEIQELDAAMVARSLPDVAFGVINGNNALLAELDIEKDAIAVEDKESIGAQTFANVLAVRAEDEDSPKTKALIKALTSEEAKKFMEETYKGAVVPVF